MWYVLRFLDGGSLQGMIVSEGASDDEAIANAKARMEVPAGEAFGLPYNGEPPEQLRYRVITLDDRADIEAIMSNAAQTRIANQWFWIRFVDEENRSERGVALSNGTTLPDALQRLAEHVPLPPGEPEGYPYPAEPPEHLRYRVLSSAEVQELSGGFAPTGIGGWVNAIVNKVQERDISTLPNANILRNIMERIERFRG
jgi:hypothetical protein